MSQNKVFKGVFLIAVAASGYGMLATIVKLAYQDHYTATEITASQFVYGILGMLIINLIRKMTSKEANSKISTKEIRQLIIAGTTLGLTSVLYYLAVKFVPASIGIVLLMQAVWMSMVIEMFIEKKKPTMTKLFAVIIILAGTVLATNLLQDQFALDWRGAVLGLLAAVSFAATMYASNQIAINKPASERTLYMLVGGAIAVFIYVLFAQTGSFNWEIFYKWGIPLALFGAIFPPLLMNAGFPYTGISLGSIVSSLELPVSVTVAYFVLNEKVILTQWIGIGLIILAIVMINLKKNE